jgi:hypothetical protein
LTPERTVTQIPFQVIQNVLMGDQGDMGISHQRIETAYRQIFGTGQPFQQASGKMRYVRSKKNL